MRFKSPSSDPCVVVENRDQLFRSFILECLPPTRAADSQPVLLLAQSPGSPVARALFELSGEIAARGYSAHVIFVDKGATGPAGDASVRFDVAFAHETRHAPSVVDGHEQLVLGAGAVWYGDVMRRDPEKRDAFSSFTKANSAIGGRARLTFARLWKTAQPLYQHALPAATPEVVAEPCAEVTGNITGIAAQSGVNETLAAWEPPLSH